MSIAIVAIAVVVLVAFLAATLVKTQKTLDSARKDLHHLSLEAVQLMQKLEALTSDIKSKTDSLNFMFRPLKSLNKESHRKDPNDTVKEVVDWVSMSLVLFDKIKTAVKQYAK